MAKGSKPAPVSQTTVSQPPEEAQKLIKLGFPYAKDFAKNPPSLPDFSLISPFDPLQTQGQNQVLGAVAGQSDVVGKAGTGNQFLSGGAALYPGSNPALDATIDASVRPVYQNLMEGVLPKIRSGAIASGNWGGSRQGIAEGIAIRGANQTAADTAAKVATTGYNSGLDAMVKAQGIAPAVAGAQALPGQTTSAVGDVRQALAQALLGEQGQRFNYQETLPLLMAKELIGLSGAIPGGSTTTTASSPQSNSLMQGLGLGVAGLGAAGQFMSGLGGLAGSAGGLTALLPFLSDRRAKTNVERIGAWRGLPIYRFYYWGDSRPHTGFMADEVVQVVPSAVTKFNGVQFVNYARVAQVLGV